MDTSAAWAGGDNGFGVGLDVFDTGGFGAPKGKDGHVFIGNNNGLSAIAIIFLDQVKAEQCEIAD